MSRKSLSDHIMTDEEAKKWGNNVRNASFIGRLFNYTIFYIIIWFMLFFTVITSQNKPFFCNDLIINSVISYIILFGIPAIIVFSIEYQNRLWRKENGFDIYKAVTADMLKQKEIDERVAMEKKAYEKAGINQGVDKNDIGYWFDLKEKGAITEDEFNEKKAELLKK